MSKHTRDLRGWWLVLMVSFLAGCASQKAMQITPLSQREQEAFFSRAQDERRFWLTKYESDYGPVFSGAHRVHTDKRAVVEFVTAKNSSLPVIEIRLRSGNTYNAVIDTGSQANWIEFDPANREGLIPIGPPPNRLVPSHVPDTIVGYLSAASRIVIDNLHVETPLFYVKAAHGPLVGLRREMALEEAPIFLGADFIRAFHFVQFDFSKRTIFFSTTNPYTPDPDRLIATVPLRSYYGILAIEGWMDGIETPFLLDSIGTYELATNLDLGPLVSQLTIDDLVVRNVAHVPISTQNLELQDVPRIGRGILERFVVTIDTRNRRIFFERPIEL
jgi:hypothetical protein